MPGCLVARPSANVIADATLSWEVSSADADYPLANAATLEPDVVAKAVDATATLRATFSGAQALEGIVAINVNWAGLTVGLTNNGGMATQNIVVPDPEDGVCVNAWWDLRGVAGASATQWNLPIVGASADVTIGTLLLIESWEQLRIRWGYRLTDLFPVIEKRTSYRKRVQYRIPVRVRQFSGLPFLAEDRNAIRTLRREALNSITPWVLIPDEEDDDALLVQFVGDPEEHYAFVAGRFDDDTAKGIVEQPVEVEEVNAGVALV